MVDEQVPAELLDTPLDLSSPKDSYTERSMESAITAIQEAIAEAKNPAVFVDTLVYRHNAVSQVKALIEKLGFPVYSSTMAKGTIDEDHPLYVGVYNGAVSGPGIKEAFEASDLLLVFGRLAADTNSGGFTQKMPIGQTIDFKLDEIDVSLLTHVELESDSCRFGACSPSRAYLTANFYHYSRRNYHQRHYRSSRSRPCRPLKSTTQKPRILRSSHKPGSGRNLRSS